MFNEILICARDIVWCAGDIAVSKTGSSILDGGMLNK